VPTPRLAKALVALAYTIAPLVQLVFPVPPRPTPIAVVIAVISPSALTYTGVPVPPTAFEELAATKYYVPA